MLEDGFRDIHNIDISAVVIEQMQEATKNEPTLTCKQSRLISDKLMDCTSMDYADETFDFLVDKSTLDAVLCGQRAFYKTALMLKECQRVLKTGG
jgi:ubiquinone/menaquinone biosynthesis C-methylase UbiE